MVFSPVAFNVNEANQLWNEVLKCLNQAIQVEEIEDWFEEVQIIESRDGLIILGVPSGYRRDYIEKNYLGMLKEILTTILQQDLTVEVHLTGPLTGKYQEQSSNGVLKEIQEPAATPLFEPINNKYVFDNFVTGECNQMAYAAAQAVAKAPAQSYNPLFVYGGVGLGKTHLMQAAGNTILNRYPEKKVVYLSAEQFVNSFIDAIKRNERLSFQSTFRNVDVLLIDDIHFLAGKESTQEEFFHTFNALHNRKKQIVISSDRPPKDIPTIEDRLRSRFEWGLIVDILPPDFEMRMAILRQKCEAVQMKVSPEVLEYIASKVRFSIRELEGALSKITAYAQFTNENINVEIAGRVLGEIYDRPVKEISIEKIQRKVADYFNIKPSDIIGKNRSRSIARPRQIAMYLSRKLTQHSFPEIGTFFGNKDHTTVLFAYNKIHKELENDANLRSTIEQLSEMFSKY